jgi:hypothetical protein
MANGFTAANNTDRADENNAIFRTVKMVLTVSALLRSRAVPNQLHAVRCCDASRCCVAAMLYGAAYMDPCCRCVCDRCTSDGTRVFTVFAMLSLRLHVTVLRAAVCSAAVLQCCTVFRMDR